MGIAVADVRNIGRLDILNADFSDDYKVLYRNDAFAWREQYQSTQDLSGFIQEDGAAVKRMSRDFAQAVVSDMLESF